MDDCNLENDSGKTGGDIGIVPGQEQPPEAFFITHTDITEEPSVDTFPSMSVTVKKKDLRVKFGAQDVNIKRNIPVRHPVIWDNYPIKKKGLGYRILLVT